MDWHKIYASIEGKLFFHFECDAWERALYYYLLAHSQLRGVEARAES